MDELLFGRSRPSLAPLLPPCRTWARFPNAPHLFDSFHSHRPGGTELLLARLEQNFTHHHVPKSNPVQAVHLELVFALDEAVQGGTFRLMVPVPDVCSDCAGLGRVGFYECDACAGVGTSLRPHSLDVLIPAGSKDGDTLPVSLAPFGVRNLYLNVHIRTGANPVQ